MQTDYLEGLVPECCNIKETTKPHDKISVSWDKKWKIMQSNLNMLCTKLILTPQWMCYILVCFEILYNQLKKRIKLNKIIKRQRALLFGKELIKIIKKQASRYKYKKKVVLHRYKVIWIKNELRSKTSNACSEENCLRSYISWSGVNKCRAFHATSLVLEWAK